MGWLSVTTGSSSARLWWIRTLLLLLGVFAYGGTSVGARLVEFVGTEGATAVSQEATTARRHSTHSTRLSDGKTLECISVLLPIPGPLPPSLNPRPFHPGFLAIEELSRSA
jgi:hypothetical protein